MVINLSIINQQRSATNSLLELQSNWPDLPTVSFPNRFFLASRYFPYFLEKNHFPGDPIIECFSERDFLTLSPINVTLNVFLEMCLSSSGSFENRHYSQDVRVLRIPSIAVHTSREGADRRYGVILSGKLAAAYSRLHGLDLGCSFTAPLVYKEASRVAYIYAWVTAFVFQSTSYASVRAIVSKCSVRVCF